MMPIQSVESPLYDLNHASLVGSEVKKTGRLDNEYQPYLLSRVNLTSLPLPERSRVFPTFTN
jgi:hypothetical protein